MYDLFEVANQFFIVRLFQNFVGKSSRRHFFYNKPATLLLKRLVDEIKEMEGQKK